MEDAFNKKENFKSPAEKLLANWKKSPVKIASSSEYRISALKSLGFEDVSSFAVPDEVEYETVEHFRKRRADRDSLGLYDPYLSDVPRYVAETKLRHLLEQNPEFDGLAFAFDTMPMSYSYNEEKEGGRSTMWSADQMTKPKSVEDAKVSIKKMFKAIIKGHNRFEEIKLKLPSDVGEFFEVGYLPRIIRVNTGIAIRVPGSAVETFSAYANLILDKVFEIKDDEAQMDSLIEKIVEIMNKKGGPMSVAGGIDYANPEIRELLKIRETLFEKTEEGVYLGFPKQYVESILDNLAEMSVDNNLK